MIQSSFLHIKGIGENTELSLWERGVRTWEDFEASLPTLFGAKKAQTCLQQLEESRSALEAGELEYFLRRLSGAHTWRLIPLCEEKIAFLDIETTGTGFPPMSHSTSIAVSFCGQLIVEHDQKKKRELLRELDREVKMWVTFNGLSFDMPFLRREFNVQLRAPHVDLRVWMRRLGYTGGLKKIQIQFDDIHQRSSMDIDGFDAVRLWRMHKKGVPGALETLMTYNAEDTVILESLLHKSWEMQCEKLPFLNLPKRQLPTLPQITTQVHSHVYDLLRGEAAWEIPDGW